MSELQRTVLHDRHVELGAKMVDFAGWHMPVQYPAGIVREHLATRKACGVFDVSHMGRLVVRGKHALPFLQHVLTNNAAALRPGESQYTIVPNAQGGAIDDAYLYCFEEGEYLLVVNASNREKVWSWFQEARAQFPDLELLDRTFEIAMISVQGPQAKSILSGMLESGVLPAPVRNALSVVTMGGVRVLLARTGYAGEPIGFELFVPRAAAAGIWDALLASGGHPVGLGARDTLRLEAALPLYGHELGTDPEGEEIPIFAMGLSRFAVSFSPLKGDFVGRAALREQYEALEHIVKRDGANTDVLPRLIKPVALTGKGIARAGDRVFRGDQLVGYITSGTMVPYWTSSGSGLLATISNETEKRSICLALIDNHLHDGADIEIEIRDRRTPGVVVPYHARSDAPPHVRAIPFDRLRREASPGRAPETVKNVHALLEKAVANHAWRQRQCINLIPSEQTISPMTRLLSVSDPVGRYAEHRPLKAFSELEVFYYQGTDFIAEVEELLVGELRSYLGCGEVEARVISGQMANAAVFSAMVDHINRTDRRREPRRVRKIVNNHIIRGGHLSAQPMGALRDFVAHDPATERPAVASLPVLPDNPYKTDVAACRDLIIEHQPELVILGKSMIIHREPLAEMREMLDAHCPGCVLMYDMAHVLGLVGPHFQEPFKEGADIVTGSTHKTYFGTQRGIIAADCQPDDARYALWEAIQRRTFPGSVSNHHLGTLLGLLMSAYEMNYFRDEYQRNVITNAKAFAKALSACGLDVAGDPAISHTETHQVIVEVGFAKGPETARRLEDNNIIVNYQATPEEEGFTASGALRLGVAEMTRFGMSARDFEELAQLVRDAIVEGKDVKDQVSALRQPFLELKYCFTGPEFDAHLQKLHEMV